MQKYLQFYKAHPRILTYGFSHTFFCCLGQTFFIAFFVPHIQKDLDLSSTAFGSLYAAGTLASSIALSVIGTYVDRSVPKKFSLFLSLSLAAACAIMAFTYNPIVLLIGIFSLRLFGQSLSPLLAQTVMAKVFHKNRGKALALSGMGLPLGEAIMPSLIGLLLATFTWRQTWLCFALLVVIVLLPLTQILGKSIRGEIDLPDPLASQNRNFSQWKLLSDRKFFLLIPTMVMNAFILTAFFFHQGFVATEKSWTLELLASAFLVFGLSRLVFNLISGEMIDRYSSLKLLKFYFLPMLFALLSLLLFEGSWVAFLYLFFCGISVGFSNNLFTSVWAEVYGVADLGAIKALSSTCAILSTALSPLIMGWAIDSGYHLATIVWISVAFVVGSYVLIYFLPRSQQANT